jgi:hypothetical protein
VGLGVGKRTTFPTVPMILAASMGPMPKISVRVVPEASTSASMRSFRSAIFRSSVRILSAAPPKLVGGGRPTKSPAAVCRAGCVQPGWPRAFRLSRRAGGLAEARASCLERSGTFGHQVFAPLGKQAQHLRVSLGIDRRQLLVARGGQSAVARASSPSFLRALPAKLESTLTRAESLGGTSTTDSPVTANLPAR